MKMLFIALGIMIICGAAFSAPDDAEDIIGNVEKALKKLKTVSFSFEQVIYQKVTDRYIRRPGKLWLKEPHLVRFEDRSKQIVADGRTVWMYIPANNQVQISAFIQDDENFPSPQILFERYSKNREAELIGSEDVNGEVCDILRLTSPNPDELPVNVWIERKRSILVKSLEETETGDSVGYELHDIVLNEKFDDGVFEFVVPEGVETIDLRE